MMSRTLGAPLGGTIVGGHHGLESLEFSSITPPNFGSGAGIWFPSIVVVALGEPDTPVTCWAPAGRQEKTRSIAVAQDCVRYLAFISCLRCQIELGEAQNQ